MVCWQEIATGPADPRNDGENLASSRGAQRRGDLRGWPGR